MDGTCVQSQLLSLQHLFAYGSAVVDSLLWQSSVACDGTATTPELLLNLLAERVHGGQTVSEHCPDSENTLVPAMTNTTTALDTSPAVTPVGCQLVGEQEAINDKDTFASVRAPDPVDAYMADSLSAVVVTPPRFPDLRCKQASISEFYVMAQDVKRRMPHIACTRQGTNLGDHGEVDDKQHPHLSAGCITPLLNGSLRVQAYSESGLVVQVTEVKLAEASEEDCRTSLHISDGTHRAIAVMADDIKAPRIGQLIQLLDWRADHYQNLPVVIVEDWDSPLQCRMLTDRLPTSTMEQAGHAGLAGVPPASSFIHPMRQLIDSQRLDACMHCAECQCSSVVALHFGTAPYALCASCSSDCPDPLLEHQMKEIADGWWSRHHPEHSWHNDSCRCLACSILVGSLGDGKTWRCTSYAGPCFGLAVPALPG